MILFLLLAFLILHFDLLRERQTYSFHQIVYPNHSSCHHLHQTPHNLSSSFSTNFIMFLTAASADNLAFFGSIIYLVSTKQIKKLLIWDNMQYGNIICSLLSYAFVFSDCNSTENVPKRIDTAKIVGCR